jgi:hypothetical protein
VRDDGRTLFFLQSGFVKVGTITPNGNEVIYDVRKGGDVIGELCASEKKRPDRAIALEQTDAISVPFEDIMALMLLKPDLVAMLIEILCRALKEAYEQVNAFASHDIIHRLSNVLLGLAAKVGEKAGSLVEIPTYHARRNRPDGCGATGTSFDGAQLASPPRNGALLDAWAPHTQCARARAPQRHLTANTRDGRKPGLAHQSIAAETKARGAGMRSDIAGG